MTNRRSELHHNTATTATTATTITYYGAANITPRMPVETIVHEMVLGFSTTDTFETVRKCMGGGTYPAGHQP